MKRSKNKPTDEQRNKLREKSNAQLSHVMKIAALIVAAIAFGSLIIGVDDPGNVLLGLCLSVILLCLATLQDHNGRNVK